MGVLLLPVLLVLFLTGSVRTEKESAVAEGADLSSDLLPLGEKVEVREAREAGKNKGKKGGKKKNAEKKKNEKNRRIKNRQKTRRLKKKSNSDKKKGLKNNKPKRNNQGKKGKKRKRKNKKRTDKIKQNKQKKKDRQRRKKKKLLNKRKSKKNGRQGPAGGDWSSCGTSGVNDTCLLNAVNALNFEKNQIQNFFKQKARLENQNKVTGNKKGKKGEFEDAAGYMLTAIGGNISSPTCGENSTRSARAAADAVSTYNTLINCSATIHETCDMPNDTINATFNANCANIYNLSKIASDDCRSNSA